jgi:hypothetical protein
MVRKLTALISGVVFASLSALPLAAAPGRPVAQAVVAAGPLTPICQAAPAFPGGVTAPNAATTVPDWLTSSSLGGKTKFHGFCPCGCSFIPDCNTSADCFGGATCQTAPSCC